MPVEEAREDVDEMLRTHTSNLPPEQRQRLHADFLANEQDYLRMRDGLLLTHRGQWVAVSQGKVSAADPDLVKLAQKVAAIGGHPYIALVGAEDQLVFRLRRTIFSYDQAYQPFAMPRVQVTFWNDSESRSQTYADVIPDTGADLSALPDSGCAAFDLFNSPCFAAVSSGVVGAAVATLVYHAKAEIDGKRYPAFIQPITGSRDRILGRDVLNQQRVLFDGPVGEVIVDP